MVRVAPVAETGQGSTPLYRRPSRLRRLGALLLTAGGALAVACGIGGGEKADDPGQVWLETDGASGRINMDDVQQAYRDAYGSDGFDVTKFENRVNEIYEGDNPVVIDVTRDDANATITGWEDLNGDKTPVDGQDDKLFTITQELKDGGNYTTQGHGANGYYHSVNPFGGFFTGLLIGNLLTGGFGNRYVTPPARYDDISSSRTAYRNSSGYAAQQARNSAYGSSLSSRYGNAAAASSVSAARSSYQSRQINSGGFRSSGSSSRSISSGAKAGTSGGGSISGGGGRLAL
ncbi:MAG: hypothetical protein AB7R89_14835 [Dehalococcoidia bacterium]